MKKIRLYIIVALSFIFLILEIAGRILQSFKGTYESGSDFILENWAEFKNLGVILNTVSAYILLLIGIIVLITLIVEFVLKIKKKKE